MVLMILAATSTAIVPTCFGQESVSTKCPPAAQKDGVVDELHGISIADPYRWLEDQQSSETHAWIDAEDHCTTAVLSNVPGRAAIARRLTELMRVDTFGLPQERAGNYFFAERRSDQELFVTYKRRGLNGADEVLIDPHPLSADHSTSVQLEDVSRDGALAAYAIRTGGQDEVTIHFMDTNTRTQLPDELPQANYFSVSIEPSKRGVYYAVQTASGTRVFHHLMGTPATADQEVFGKGYGRDKILDAQLSEDGRTLLIAVVYGSGSRRSELYFKDLEKGGAVEPIVNDLESLFFGQAEDGQVYIYSNWKAPHWRVFRADLNRPSREHWKEIIPESDATIEGMSLAGGKIILQYVRNASSELKVFDPDGQPEGAIPLPGPGAVYGVRSDWHSHDAFFSFQSFNVPDSVYKYDLLRHTVDRWAAPQVPINEKAYAVEQIWYRSKDQTRVPMFLFYKRGMARDGMRPTLLTGYGGFDVDIMPAFDPAAIVWVDRGGVFAVANLRGGGEFGEAWHHAGMMEKKQNVFDDFIAAAEWLIANRYTSPQKLAIEGASNGGLLVGAALTQRPDLFRAVVCEYPLLDMLRYQKFMEGPFWVPEYGSADNAAQFKYIYAYSPYQNVKDGTNYPAVLFVTGDGDTRVAPLHARKMTARMQAATGSNRPVLLLYDTKSGHSGGRPLNKQIEEGTDVLSFLSLELGATAE
jgi:prolyl oligopeptidase